MIQICTRIVRTVCAITFAGSLSACVAPPMAVSHQHISADKSHWGVQLTMSTGVPGTPVQTVMLVYNKYQKNPVAQVSGQSLRLSDKLADAIVNLGPAIVTGQYMIRAAKVECPAGTLCGTLVQVQNSAGANADSTATAAQGGTGS